MTRLAVPDTFAAREVTIRLRNGTPYAAAADAVEHDPPFVRAVARRTSTAWPDKTARLHVWRSAEVASIVPRRRRA